MQPFDPAGRYSDAAVLAVLTAQHGTRTMRYRYDRLNELNTFIEPIDWVAKATVANNNLADIKRTATFGIIDRGGINYLKDRIQPWAVLDMPDGGAVEWPLGVFLLATPARGVDAVGIVAREVKAYDQLVVLRQDRVDARYTVAAGVTYTTAIATLIATVSGIKAAIVPSALTLPAVMEWEPGTTKLRVLNDLLAAINYGSAWFNEVGTLICRPYQSPADRAVEYDYADDSASVRTGDAQQTIDLFDIPNKWVLVVSDPDRPPLVGTYTNTSPSSPTSTVSRGRTIVDVVEEEDAADQATLNAKAQRYAFDASQVYEGITFDTAIMPMHSDSDVLSLDIPDLAVSGKYGEKAWSFELRAGATMTHEVRRVVTI